MILKTQSSQQGASEFNIYLRDIKSRGPEGRRAPPLPKSTGGGRNIPSPSLRDCSAYNILGLEYGSGGLRLSSDPICFMLTQLELCI